MKTHLPVAQISGRDSSQDLANGQEVGSGAITRRKFLRRTGGAAVATVVAFQIATQSASAVQGGSGSAGWGMLCLIPDAVDVPKTVATGAVNIPQAAGGATPMQVKIVYDTSKIADALSTEPYNYCDLTGTAEISVYEGGALKSFKGYTCSFVVTCDEGSGELSGQEYARNWLTSSLSVKIGTTDVNFQFSSAAPIQPQANGTLFCVTGVAFQFGYTDPTTNQPYASNLIKSNLSNLFAKKKK